MWKKNFSRREFIKRNSLAGLGTVLAMNLPAGARAGTSRQSTVPAILGGDPVRKTAWPSWPVWSIEEDEKHVVEVLRSGSWWRGGSRQSVVDEFERQYAAALGVKRCLAMVNGTNSLITSLKMLDVGGGDEVIVTPYTFIATTHAILEAGAMPVFADVDPETFQINPALIEEKITPRTRAIMPVHILGIPSDMTTIMKIAEKHNLLVIEDACQAWLAEIGNRKVGTFGNAGCFSFQNSKHLAIGEGGAIISNDELFMDKCVSYHNTGRPYGRMVEIAGSSSGLMGNNLRMTEYQAAIGLAQLKRLEGETRTRSRNAEYLRSRIGQIPGILPYRLYDDVTLAVFHLFPFRYKKEEFSGMPRPLFMRALRAEGVPSSAGYGSNLNSDLYLKDAFDSKNFRLMYPPEMLDFEGYLERNRCPENDRLCNEEAVWFSQNLLLGTAQDMDDVYNALEKIHANSRRIMDSQG